MVEVSVFVPMFNSKHIGWAVLESLIRQEKVEFEWELIIVEENNNDSFGKDMIFKYEPFLNMAGCKEIKYIGLKKWISVPEKFIISLENINESSELFFPHAADCYIPPMKFFTSYNKFKNNNIDIFGRHKVIYYDILTESVAILNKKGKRGIGIIDYVVKSNIIKKSFYDNKIKKGIDGWFLKEYIKNLNRNPICFLDDTDNWKYGLNIHGLNQISLNRGKKIINKTGNFKKIDWDINQYIPKSVVDGLKNCKKYIRK